ncbi:uncharacterized protein I206_105026 [Kwoniella pini CBS 10737]|uniref:Uncharacterized protein n=1 Tax=Kwoniella pini CBS 10737 TaxID=1296096 RepID=A0A1B9I8L3_9TREE|nr:uncharacterized protein I206_02566 [Kwoniella pini CBS 10737]OCF51850.1 hypothetical protein I206_02566 [Kwoniella pini CBS 10737]
MNTRIFNSRLTNNFYSSSSFSLNRNRNQIIKIQKRKILTFPHPNLDLENGSTKFIIRCLNGNFKSQLHLYEILKQLEKKLNFEIFNFNLQKNFDNLQKPNSTIFLTTLKPLHLNSSNSLNSLNSENSDSKIIEIKFNNNFTKFKESNFLGGISFNDIQNILNSKENSLISSSSSSSLKEKEKENIEILQIKIEVQKNISIKKKYQPKNLNKRQRYSQNGFEASEIVKSLKKFKGGFYGGFEGLAEKFDHLIIKPKVEEEIKV